MVRKMTMLVLGLVLALGGVLAGAGVAQAAASIPPGYGLFRADDCNVGRQIAKLHPTNRLGDTQGTVLVNDHGNGVLCAIAYHQAGRPTQVRIDVRNANWSQGAYDSGVFSFYAGGIGTNVDVGPRKCIIVSASVELGPESVNQFRLPNTTVCR